MSPTMTLLSSGLTLAVYWIGTYLIDAVSQGEKLDIFSDKVVFFNYAIQVIMAFMLLNMIFYPSAARTSICKTFGDERRRYCGKRQS